MSISRQTLITQFDKLELTQGSYVATPPMDLHASDFPGGLFRLAIELHHILLKRVDTKHIFDLEVRELLQPLD